MSQSDPNPPVSRAEAEAYRARWQLVNQAEIEELRNTPLEVKLRQLAALMASVNQMGWTEAMASEVDEVREKWRRLRAAYAP